MRNENGAVLADFRLPSAPPSALLDPYRNYRRLADEYDAACLDYLNAANAIVLAREADVSALAAAAVENVEAEFDRQEEGARRAAADAQLRRDALAEALDIAGDTLMDAIDATKSDWLAALVEEAAQAKSTFSAAIDAASVSAETIAQADGAAAWLNRFQGHKMKTGGSPPGTQRTLMWNQIPMELQAAVPGSTARMSQEMAPARELLSSLRNSVTS